MMSRGLILDRASQPSPQRSSVPTRKFSIRMSASLIKLLAISWPSGTRKFSVTDFLLRPMTCHQSGLPASSVRPHWRMASPWPGASILTTSAPKSAMIWPQNGPAMSWPISTTLIPSSGPMLSPRWVFCRRLFGPVGLTPMGRAGRENMTAHDGGRPLAVPVLHRANDVPVMLHGSLQCGGGEVMKAAAGNRHDYHALQYALYALTFRHLR